MSVENAACPISKGRYTRSNGEPWGAHYRNRMPPHLATIRCSHPERTPPAETREDS